MATVIGVILILLFITAVIGLAAIVTWVVVKISPKKKPPADETPAATP